MGVSFTLLLLLGAALTAGFYLFQTPFLYLVGGSDETVVRCDAISALPFIYFLKVLYSRPAKLARIIRFPAKKLETGFSRRCTPPRLRACKKFEKLSSAEKRFLKFVRRTISMHIGPPCWERPAGCVSGLVHSGLIL